MKREANWNVVLNSYLREKKMYLFYELKQTNHSEIFRFASIEQCQWSGLQATEKHGLVWKLSDEISRPKPCDGFSIPPLPSYLIIKFMDEFVFIRFEKIIELRDEGIISIDKSTAEKIAERIIKT